LWKGADALVIDSGALNEEELYSKSAAIQIWLLGIEFTNTVIVICSRAIHVLTDAKKAALLAPLKTAENATLPLEVHVKDKADKNKANYAILIKAIKSSHAGVIVACLLKEKPLGEFSSLWRAALEAAEGLQQVELGPPLAHVLSVKDLDEQVFPPCVTSAHCLPDSAASIATPC
jgi:nucleosome binding factor SPN SPT16 subunit